MSVANSPIRAQIAQIAIVDLAKPAGTYDLVTAVDGPVALVKVAAICTATAQGLIAVTIQNDEATSFTILDATAGASANLMEGAQVLTSWDQLQPILIRAGKKLQYSIVGDGSAGAIALLLIYVPSADGAGLV